MDVEGPIMAVRISLKPIPKRQAVVHITNSIIVKRGKHYG
jgi:hypothetical protein